MLNSFGPHRKLIRLSTIVMISRWRNQGHKMLKKVFLTVTCLLRGSQGSETMLLIATQYCLSIYLLTKKSLFECLIKTKLINISLQIWSFLSIPCFGECHHHPSSISAAPLSECPNSDPTEWVWMECPVLGGMSNLQIPPSLPQRYFSNPTSPLLYYWDQATVMSSLGFCKSFLIDVPACTQDWLQTFLPLQEVTY